MKTGHFGDAGEDLGIELFHVHHRILLVVNIRLPDRNLTRVDIVHIARKTHVVVVHVDHHDIADRDHVFAHLGESRRGNEEIAFIPSGQHNLQVLDVLDLDTGCCDGWGLVFRNNLNPQIGGVLFFNVEM